MSNFIFSPSTFYFASPPLRLRILQPENHVPSLILYLSLRSFTLHLTYLAKIFNSRTHFMASKLQVFNIGSCAANKTQPLTNGTCKPRPPRIMSKAYNFCKTCAVAALNFWMNGPKMLSNAMDSIYNGAIWLVSKGHGGVTFAINWTQAELILLTYKARDGMIVAKEWSWVQVKWLVWNAFYALMLTTYWTFYIVWWIGSGIWVQIEWIGDAVNFYYYFYLESKLRFCYAHRITTPLNSYYLVFFCGEIHCLDFLKVT